ncbi:hypothetical protein [Streptomyces chattanoogensis]|uniref:hypothetical protein n=1 Tax=Streptomyces chattanoogensis TaxID=66876 RepID=UPI00062CC6AB
MAGHRVEGPDRLVGAVGAFGHQTGDPLDLAAQLVQPLPAHRRGQQFRSQIHSPDHPATDGSNE